MEMEIVGGLAAGTAPPSGPTDAWPLHAGCPWAGQGPVQTTYTVSLAGDGHDLELVRNLVSAGAVVVRTICWSRRHRDRDDAADCYGWLIEQGDRLSFFAVASLTFGRGWLSQTVDEGVVVMRARRAHEFEVEAQLIARFDEAARKAGEINAYYREHEGRRVLALERASAKRPLWTIAFKDAWERERFWDWLKWQRPRFEELAALAAGLPPLELERRLLNEMLATENAMRKRGLGAGGRRPLRFWRGELR